MQRCRWLGVFAAALVAVPCGCTLIIGGDPPTITPDFIPNAVEDSSYTVSLVADMDGVEWSVVAGQLPPGLALDDEDGVIAGRPTTPGTYDFTVRASAGPRAGERVYAIVVHPVLRVQAALEPGRVGASYSDEPAISGGVPPYEVSVVGLPAGLDSDASTGEVFGTPLIEDDWLIEFSVRDSGAPQQIRTARTTLEVHPLSVTILTTDLPLAPFGEEFRAELEADDGRPPYAWRISAGVLPQGLRLNRLTGEISGVPGASARTREFTASVTDSDSPASSDEQELKLVVPVKLITDEVEEASAGVAYEFALGAIAGLPPYTWAVVGGSLPDGLELDPATGVVEGTPAVAGATSVTIRVTDSDDPPTTEEAELTFTVVP